MNYIGLILFAKQSGNAVGFLHYNIKCKENLMKSPRGVRTIIATRVGLVSASAANLIAVSCYVHGTPCNVRVPLWCIAFFSRWRPAIYSESVWPRAPANPIYCKLHECRAPGTRQCLRAQYLGEAFRPCSQILLNPASTWQTTSGVWFVVLVAVLVVGSFLIVSGRSLDGVSWWSPDGLLAIS